MVSIPSECSHANVISCEDLDVVAGEEIDPAVPSWLESVGFVVRSLRDYSRSVIATERDAASWSSHHGDVGFFKGHHFGRVGVASCD
jgi:hypothetical protein